MSNARQDLLRKVISVTNNSYLQQSTLLANASRLSSACRMRFTSIIQAIALVENLDSEAEVADAIFERIDQTELLLAACEDQDAFNNQIDDFLSCLSEVVDMPEDFVSSFSSEDLLNKRMIDLIGNMKKVVRFTARRHNDDGGTYDKSAFISVRNQLYFARHTYIEQLDQDIAQASNEDCARIEQIFYPNIKESSAEDFVDALNALLDFLNTKLVITLA